MKKHLLALACAALLAATAQAQETKVAIGISGWTGFAPLTLAKEAGLFKKHGLDVSIKKIPQKDRHLAIASGDVQCAATTVETWVGWNAAGVTTTQIFQLDKSYGADGMVVKPGIAKISDLKGKTVAAKALADGYFDALEMIKSDPKKSFEIMGADVKQSGEAFEASQKYLRWQDRAANQKFFAGEHQAFTKEAADVLLEVGVIKQIPDLSKLADTQFIK